MPSKLFHEILEHRWYLAEEQDADVDAADAVADYVDTHLRRDPLG